MRNGARIGVAVNGKLRWKTEDTVVEQLSREQKKCKSSKSLRVLCRRIVRLLGWALKY